MARRGSPSPLSRDTEAFLQRGVSIVVASRDADNVPASARAIGCRYSARRRDLRLLLRRSQAEPLLASIASSGVVAAVFSEPSTHATIQIKGGSGRETAIEAGDVELAQRYATLFAAEIAPLGFPEEWTRALVACPAAELAAISFSPEQAFDQTPGPRAGAPIES